MKSFIKLYSTEKNEIKRFLNTFLYNSKDVFNNLNTDTLEFQIDYQNPVEIADILGVFIDNKDDYKVNMWISIDEDVLINVTPNNADDIIKYLYERFPY